LDRIDIFIQVPRIKATELSEKKPGRSTEELKKIVEQVRQIQKERFKTSKIHRNAEMSNKDILLFASISDEARQIAISSTEKLHLSTRVFYRILRVARTIADIDESKSVSVKHVLEALSYRGN
jgi:magnesium chelatase family protein